MIGSKKGKGIMKKIALALALTAGFVLAGYAEESSENPFQKANEKYTQGKAMKGGWVKGKVEITEQDGKKVYTVTPDDPKVTGLIYCGDKVNVKAGDRIQARIKASGKGKMFVAIWCYPERKEGAKKDTFLCAAHSKRKALTEESQELIFDVVIPDKEEIVSGRTAINFAGGSEVVIEEVEFKFAE